MREIGGREAFTFFLERERHSMNLGWRRGTFVGRAYIGAGDGTCFGGREMGQI